MPRKARITDEEFMAQVARWADAEEVASRTGYSVATVRSKVRQLQQAGHTVEYAGWPTAMYNRWEDDGTNGQTDEPLAPPSDTITQKCIRCGNEHTYSIFQYIDHPELCDRCYSEVYDEPLVIPPTSTYDTTVTIQTDNTRTIKCDQCGSPFEMLGDCDTPPLCNACLFKIDEFGDGWDTCVSFVKEAVNNSPDIEAGEYGDGYDAGWYSAVAHFDIATVEDRPAEWHRDHHDALLMNEGYDMRFPGSDYDWGWEESKIYFDGLNAERSKAAFDTGYHTAAKKYWEAGTAHGEILAALDSDDASVLDRLPEWQDGWASIVQVEWLRVLARLAEMEAGL